MNDSLEEIKQVSAKGLGSALRRLDTKPSVIVIDGIVTNGVISASEEAGVNTIIAKNFATTDTSIKLLSL